MERFAPEQGRFRKGQITGTYDVILLCCKAYDLNEAIVAITPAMGERSLVLPLLNGIRHIDVLTETFGASRVLGGVTVNAALQSDGSIQQSQVRINMNAIGELDGESESARCNAIKTALETGGIPVVVSNNIVVMMWMKFFWLRVQCHNRIPDQISRRSYRKIIRRDPFVSAVIEECSRVVAAEGYPPTPDIPSNIRGLFTQPESSYGPSLLVDMEEGRATDGEDTIGDLVKRAARCASAPLSSAPPCAISRPMKSTANKYDLKKGPRPSQCAALSLDSRPRTRGRRRLRCEDEPPRRSASAFAVIVECELPDPGGIDVDRQVELHRLLDRRSAGLVSFKIQST